MKPTYAELLECLVDMVYQHCDYPANPEYVYDYALSANETAFALLERAGKLKRLKTRPSVAKWVNQ